MKNSSIHLIFSNLKLISPYENWKIIHNEKQQSFVWNLNLFELYKPSNRTSNSYCCYYGLNDLVDETTGMNNVNCDVINFLLKNQHLIPTKWRKFDIFFLGTTFWHKEDNCFIVLHMRYGIFSEKKWDIFDSYFTNKVGWQYPITKETRVILFK